MSSLRLASLAGALLLATACAEGSTGSGLGASGGSGQGGSASPAGSGGAGQGGDGHGSSGDQGGDSSPASSASSASSSGQGGDGGSVSSTASSTTDGSSSAMASSSSGQIDPGTIFFSEYVEGEGNDKALEIYNASSSPIDLGNCQLDRYQNGASSPAAPVPLADESLAPGAVFVICQSNFSQPGKCDRLTADVQHNGDDAVALVCGGETKDIFGRIGVQETWGSGDTSSQDATLRRKCTVTEGDTNGSNAFDPADEWTGAGLGNFTDLGQHTCP